MSKITGSIVLYKNEESVVLESIKSFLNSKSDVILYLIDNSPTNNLKDIYQDDRIIYIHNPENPGFGASHNLAFKFSIRENAKYHFVINPDVYFDVDVITNMVNFMEDNDNVGMVMPRILNIDGTAQFLPKLLPSPYSLLMRKVKFPKSIYNKFINKYELREIEENLIYEAPILSGCFTLFRTEALKEVGLYDEKFFMYFEDWDISRRMHLKYKTIYLPDAYIYHGYESGANKNKNLFKIYLSSAFYYFSKWGWFFDKERKRINKKTLKQFSY